MNPDGSKPQTQLAYDARANELFFVGDRAAYNKQFDYYPAGAVVSNADPCVDQSIPVPARSNSFAKPIHTQSILNQHSARIHPFLRQTHPFLRKLAPVLCNLARKSTPC